MKLIQNAWANNPTKKPIFPAKTWFQDMTKKKNYTKRATELLKFGYKTTRNTQILKPKTRHYAKAQLNKKKK